MATRAMVTGAFSYTGRRIATKLIDRGWDVRTLTNRPARADALASIIEAQPLALDDPERLRTSLSGVDVLFNTYWVRFERGRMSFDRAVRNTLCLLEAARQADVSRVVHVSITNPESGHRLPYFEGKLVTERTLRASGMPHGIVRPTVMFGHGDVFISNIAWLLRRFPFFAVPGDGTYRLQPVHVDDVADLCIDAALAEENVIVDAAGPEVYGFDGLLRLVAEGIGRNTRLVHVPPRVALGLARLVGLMMRDVILTRHELDGLMREQIVSHEGSPCTTRLSDWLSETGAALGQRYTSEMARHFGTNEHKVATVR